MVRRSVDDVPDAVRAFVMSWMPKRAKKDAKEGHTHAAVARVSVYNSAAISHTTSGTFQGLTFDSEYFDTHAMHSSASNTGRLTCTIPGTYIAIGSFNWAAASGGRRMGEIRLNGS